MGSEKGSNVSSKDIAVTSITEMEQQSDDTKGENRDMDKSVERGSNGDDEADKYPQGAKFILLTIALMLAVFIMALDTTIIATAVPKITSRFHSIKDIGWYTSAYLLPLMSLQPTFGKIYSFYSVKPIFSIAMLAFEVGSVICATAPSSGAFILGRAISGIGAAALYSGGMVIIMSAVPLSRISVYLATLSSMYAVASLTGPPIGGLFTDSARLTWRFCFWINLPLGLISLLAFMLIYKEPKRDTSKLSTREKIAQMDVGGTILFVTSIVLLFIALQLGGNAYAWGNVRVLVCLILAGLTFIGFVVLQSRLKERATIPPHLFYNRSVACSVLAMALISLGVNSHTFYLPFYFQSAKGTTAVSSGLRLLPYTMSVTVAELVVGAGSSFLGLFLPFMYGGTAVFTIAAGLFCTLTIGTATAKLVGYQILAGVGVGSSMQLCATSLRVAVEGKDAPLAATLSVFAPFFGSSLGAAIAQNIFRISLKSRLLHFLSNEAATAVIEAGGTGIREATNPVTEQPVMEAYSYALSRVFILAAVAGGVAFVGTLCIKWRTLREAKKPAEGGSGIEEGPDDAKTEKDQHQ